MRFSKVIVLFLAVLVLGSDDQLLAKEAVSTGLRDSEPGEVIVPFYSPLKDFESNGLVWSCMVVIVQPYWGMAEVRR